MPCRFDVNLIRTRPVHANIVSWESRDGLPYVKKNKEKNLNFSTFFKKNFQHFWK